jgi:two-component system LytT family response regulator
LPKEAVESKPDLIRVILVDDERLMRQHLGGHLGNHPEIEIVGEADSVTSAWKLISEVHPEVVFLDVQMGPQDGFELLPLLEELSEPPMVVFVTAFDTFAIRAFDANALDYLTKPIIPERLKRTVEKILRELKLRRVSDESPLTAKTLGSNEKPSPATATSPTPDDPVRDDERKLGPDDLVMLPEKPGIRMIRAREIRAVEAHGNYALFYLARDKATLMKKVMNHWEEILPTELFLRAHRSLIVNVELITGIVKISRDEYQVFFKDLSKPIIVSRLSLQRIREKVPRL